MQVDASAPNPVDNAMSIAWALLRAKVNHLTKGAILASVLAKAPHLAKLCDPTATDPHLEKTQDLLSVYSPQNSQDILVNKALFAPVANPLPRTIWHKVLLNLFVNFEQPFCFNG